MSKLAPDPVPGVPWEELVLAEMIANAEEHGLKFCVRDSGMDNTDGLYVPVTGSADAVGAYLAFKGASRTNTLSLPYEELQETAAAEEVADFTEYTGLNGCAVSAGNDANDITWPSMPYALGAAYRAYHLDD
jgi:hypothetical protein